MRIVIFFSHYSSLSPTIGRKNLFLTQTLIVCFLLRLTCSSLMSVHLFSFHHKQADYDTNLFHRFFRVVLYEIFFYSFKSKSSSASLCLLIITCITISLNLSEPISILGPSKKLSFTLPPYRLLPLIH